MNLDQKVTIAKRALDSIIDHDDAPLEEVKARFESIAAYATERMTAAVLRRAAKAEKSPIVIEKVGASEVMTVKASDLPKLKGCPLGH